MADSDATMLTRKAVARIGAVVREVESQVIARGTAGWNPRRGGDGGSSGGGFKLTRQYTIPIAVADNVTGGDFLLVGSPP